MLRRSFGPLDVGARVAFELCLIDPVQQLSALELRTAADAYDSLKLMEEGANPPDILVPLIVRLREGPAVAPRA